MKDYPSISGSTGNSFQEFDAYVFDKIDGSNLRMQWGKKGWYKFGTRTRLFDESDPVFGPAKALFMEQWSEPLTKIARDNRWNDLVVFCEFWGPQSFAGIHIAEDPKTLTLFDIAPNKKGIAGPKEFLDLCEHLPIAKFLGRIKWTRGLVDRIRQGEVEGITFEGVVGKAGEGHHQIRAKAKTQAWIDKIHSRYTQEEAEKLINS